MYHINFIASAYDRLNDDMYQSFLIPFTFFALLTDPKSHVEMIVENVVEFKSKYKKELTLLKKTNEHFLIREPTYPRNMHLPNTYRFFEKPHVDANYTYIADIDIMFLEKDMVSKYIQFWPNGLPYNNMLRKENSSQITGVHMVKTKDYFTEQMDKCQQKYYNSKRESDEVILGKMCSETFGLPEYCHRFRPIYGIHFSPNRGTNKSMGLKTSKIYYDTFMEIKGKYEELFECSIFQKLVKQLEEEFIVTGREVSII